MDKIFKMDFFVKKNCEKEREYFSDCIIKNYDVAVFAPYQCVDYFKLYNNCMIDIKKTEQK